MCQWRVRPELCNSAAKTANPHRLSACARRALEGAAGANCPAIHDQLRDFSDDSRVLPHLERIRSEFDIEFLADIKPNLSKQQIYALANSGFVAVQLGIESLSDQLLIRMRKGNRALQHLQTLKWFNEAGIAVHYNILTHIPGETAEDYREALAYARHIQHINPPSGVFPIELNRYAPLFENWSAYGFQRPVPSPFYEAILDRDRIDLQRFSYAFVGHHPATREASVTKAREEFMGFVETKWIPEYPLENFFYWVGPGRV